MADRQLQFFKRADCRTRRLWFIWDSEGVNGSGCGCCGGCQFLSSSIQRQAVPIQRDSLKDLPLDPSYPAAGSTSRERGSTSKERGSTPLLAVPSQFPFTSLKTLQYLHSTIVSYHFTAAAPDQSPPTLRRKISVEEPTGHTLPSSSSLPSINVISDQLQESDDESYISAKDYFDDMNEDPFHSVHNTPRASARHSRQSSKQSIQTGPGLEPPKQRSSVPLLHPSLPLSNRNNTDLSSHYNRVLDTYNCHWRTIKLYRKTGINESPPTEHKSGSGLNFGGGATPKRGRRKEDCRGPKFVLDVPEFTSVLGRLPYVLHSHVLDSQPARCKGSAEKTGENSAMFSVDVAVNSFDVFVTPPFVQVIDRYVGVAIHNMHTSFCKNDLF